MADDRNEDDERVSRQVVYTHTTSTRQNIGAIIAIIVVALLLLGFIIVQMRHNPPHRRSELDRGAAALWSAAAQPALSRVV